MSCLPGLTPGGEKNRVVTAEQLAEKLPFSKPPKKIRRLRDMADSPDPRKREVAAGHPDTPYWVIVALSVDVEESVRAWVLRNPSVPYKLVKEMADDEDETPMIRAGAKALAEKMQDSTLL